MIVTFDDWTQGRAVRSLGTNAGSPSLPFQGWHRFKEAFAPELVSRAFSESKIPVERCVDPFGGSGTTALACQFLGVHPITVEVNPFLADLIEAKLATYDGDRLAGDFGRLVRRAATLKGNVKSCFRQSPITFVEPGAGNRWIFDRGVASRIAAWREAVDHVSDLKHRRFFRVLLAGILIDVSNVVISGKGRRYRRGWEDRQLEPHTVDQYFCDAVHRAIAEVNRHVLRPRDTFKLYRGDCRTVLRRRIRCDLGVFSPPYPNSFDYTDVYNVELWSLGYLKDKAANKHLRGSTFSSHVQTSRDFPAPPSGSRRLERTLQRLAAKRAELWDHRIPEMVGAYFTDLMSVLKGLSKGLNHRGTVWMVVGESCYAGVRIETAAILQELIRGNGWHLEHVEDCRSMRSSPQHGGQPDLAETLMVLSQS